MRVQAHQRRIVEVVVPSWSEDLGLNRLLRSVLQGQVQAGEHLDRTAGPGRHLKLLPQDVENISDKVRRAHGIGRREDAQSRGAG